MAGSRRVERPARRTGGGARVSAGLVSAGLATLVAASPAALAQGDAARGGAIAASRSLGLCVLCHALPDQPVGAPGSIGPPLAGVGARLDADALRQRLLTPGRFNPDTVMPAYGRSAGLTRVAAARQGQPLLSPAQIDDVVAYLVGLR